MERVLATVENLSTTLGHLTVELRKTNDNVQAMTVKMALQEVKVDTHAKEIFTGDSSSRIRTVELHIKGLYTCSGFIALTLGGMILATLSRWLPISGK